MPRLFFSNAIDKQAAQSPALLKALWAFEGGLASLLVAIIRLMPVEMVSATGKRILTRHATHTRKTDKIRRNLEIAFPDKTDEQLDALVSVIWGNFGSILAEYPHLGNLTGRDFDKRFEVVHLGRSKTFNVGGPPAVFVGSHLSNWELAPGILHALKVPVTALVAPLQNPWMDRLMHRLRSASGARLLARGNSVRDLMRNLKQGRSIGFVVDQRVDSGEPITFFGHDKLTSTTPARIALRFNCDLIPMQVERLENVHFRVTFHEPIRPCTDAGDTSSQARQMMQQVNNLFEAWIRHRPDEWFCSQRRWPKALHKGLTDKEE